MADSADASASRAKSNPLTKLKMLELAKNMKKDEGGPAADAGSGAAMPATDTETPAAGGAPAAASKSSALALAGKAFGISTAATATTTESSKRKSLHGAVSKLGLSKRDDGASEGIQELVSKAGIARVRSALA